jgi:NADH dehydrogenase FAD-containing subunit
MPARGHLVIAGAGHAHLDLLAALAGAPRHDWDVTLVMPTSAFAYSGVLPAVIAGTMAPEEGLIPIDGAARAAGMRVVLAAVTGLDAAAQTVTLSTGETLSFDLLTLDVGNVPLGLERLSGAELVYPVRPYARALALLEALDGLARRAGGGARVPVAVIGAGAAGVEIACAVRARLARAGAQPAVTLVDPQVGDGCPLPGFRPSVRRAAARALAARGIALQAGSVTAVAADGIALQLTPHDRLTLDSHATIWTTGAAAPAWLAASGLPVDSRGFPLADPTLALNAAQTIFGGGDCITLRHAPHTAKAGVYAVRMAPVLAANVLSRMAGAPAQRDYAPQRDFLALLSTGDGQAMLRWKQITVTSRWALTLKNRIDGAYMARYRAAFRHDGAGGN